MKTRRKGPRIKYQGKEFKATLQAPSMEALDEMIGGLNEYALEHGLEPVTILRKRKDPDGGFEATVAAHNWNPIKWIKARVGEYKEGRQRRRIEEETKEEAELTRRQPLLEARAKAAKAESKVKEVKGKGAVRRIIGGVEGIGKRMAPAKRRKGRKAAPQIDLFDISRMRELTTFKVGKAGDDPLAKLREISVLGPKK